MGRRGGRSTCENCLSIDVRQLRRKRLLSPGQSFPWSWEYLGEACGGISIRTEADALILSFRVIRHGSCDSELIEQSVPVEWTDCALGGRRPWFRCTACAGDRRCDRRVAMLYLSESPIFACRSCHGLAYASQFEAFPYRGIGKAQKIRLQLGGSPNLLDAFPDKPKGLHWRTYERLRNIHDLAERRFS